MLVPQAVWDILIQLSVVTMGLVSGGTFVVPAIQKIKTWLNLSGGSVLILVGVVSTIITFFAAVAEGAIAPGTITPNTWGGMLLAIIIQSNIRYQQLKDDMALE